MGGVRGEEAGRLMSGWRDLRHSIGRRDGVCSAKS